MFLWYIKTAPKAPGEIIAFLNHRFFLGGGTLQEKKNTSRRLCKNPGRPGPDPGFPGRAGLPKTGFGPTLPCA